MIVSSCSSMSVDDMALDVAPRNAAPRPVPSAASQSISYPNVNIAATPATNQISPQERQDLVNELSGKLQAQGPGRSGTMSEADYLKRLAQQSQADTLNAIETAN